MTETAVQDAPNAAAFNASAFAPEELERLTTDIIAALKTVYDPEIPADIYELGLIYKVDIEDDRTVKIEMTLTAPGCPVAGEMPGWVADAVEPLAGVKQVNVEMTFDPPWGMDKAAARLGRRASPGPRPRQSRDWRARSHWAGHGARRAWRPGPEPSGCRGSSADDGRRACVLAPMPVAGARIIQAP